MEYIIIKNDIITEHLCGDILPDNAIQVPDNFPGFIGESIKKLSNDMLSVKPLSQQVEENIVTIPDGMKINDTDDEFIRMEQEEIDMLYQPRIYAYPDTFNQLTIHKTFDAYGRFDYHVPDKANRMLAEQPDIYYKANQDGSWSIDDNKLAETIRNKRNKLLQDTDYLINRDYPIDDERLQKVIVYRQALRDIPTQEGFPRNVTFPVLT